MDFKIVDIDLRNLPPMRARKLSPLIEALLKGETVFIEDDGKTQSRITKYYETAHRHKKQFNTRKQIIEGKTGFVCWFSDKK